ncbi:MAG: hypothetical protein V3581_02000 [Candidatus Cardinium sp.]|uniref:hypothetical protein n=1 Tax=Candidatus Cardinium sp. TP TaxID=2961955 RepID=UPI0021AF1142|nr:hypothetical protein [Candidatus Cardinium sp. TP]MCT4697009.1 hypothetical protein [Candidatus Cardinium sp. TP]MDN5246935.1 hypothetical protein [Candidatus Cardinium sp.]
MKAKLVTKPQLSILLANALIHFDTALYGYLVPIIAPLFFPKKGLVVQLIGGYSPLMISFVAKPLGLLFFSKMAQERKASIALRYTLLGVGVSLVVMSCLPIDGALWGMIGLLAVRTCAESCAAGEHHIAKIYLLQGLAMQQAKKLASFYEIATMAGILSAGAVGTCFVWIKNPLLYWRLPFLIAALSTLLNVVLFRLKAKEEEVDGHPYKTTLQPIYRPIIRIAIVAGFGYIAYTTPFLFMNSFVPMVTTFTYVAMMQYLPIFMVLDIILIGWVAKVGYKYDHNNLMAVASGLVALSIIPLFAGLPAASIFYVTAVRCWLIFLGVVFSCFLTIWAKEQVAVATSYVTIGFATVLGSSLFGKSATAICFYLFHRYNSPIAPACYIALLAFAATLVMMNSASK